MTSDVEGLVRRARGVVGVGVAQIDRRNVPLAILLRPWRPSPREVPW